MTDKETAAPFTGESSKQEMIDHLRNAHGITRNGPKEITVLARNTKVTKDQMERMHSAAHKVLDLPDDERYVVGGRVFPKGDTRHRGVLTPVIPHLHESQAVAPEVTAAVEALHSGKELTSTGKPLATGQRTLLIKMVNNDFAATKIELQRLAGESLAVELKQLELDWRDRQARRDRWLQEVKKLNDKTNDRIARLRSQAQLDGIELRFNDYHMNNAFDVNAKMEGYDKAVAQAKDENKKNLERALLRLERERLRLERRVYMAGLEPDLRDVLDQVPSAETMLREAAQREADANASAPQLQA